jgi:hypothetical protein
LRLALMRIPSWLAPMWCDVRALRRRNEELDREIEALQAGADMLERRIAERECRIRRLRLVGAVAVAEILELAALPGIGQPRYDAQIFRGQLLQHGLIEQDVDLLIDTFNESGRGAIVEPADPSSVAAGRWPERET